MKQLQIIFLIATVAILLCACPNNEEGHRYINLVNKSGKDIGSQMLWKGKITSEDTIFQCDIIPNYIIPPDSNYMYECSLRSLGWEEDFRAIPYIQFLIMDGEIYRKYMLEPCDTIRKYVPILHCFQLKLEDLQRMNWTVVYPPEE